MKFGIHFGTRGAAGDREGLRTLAQAVERHGFEHLGLSDHIVIAKEVDSPYPYTATGKWFAHDTGFCLEQIGALNFVAAITERLRLLTSVMVVPYREPILAAKMLATVDILSAGRLTVGFGAGWMAEEMALLGSPPYAARGRVTEEYLQAFKTLWTEAAPQFDGEFVQFQSALAEPKPMQSPHPPLWSGGETKPARRRAVALADGWYPVINNPKNPLDTPARYARSIGDLKQRAETANRDPAELDQALLAIGFRLTDNPIDDPTRSAFQGSAEQILTDIEAYERLGLQHLIISFESNDLSRTLEILEQFATEIMAPSDSEAQTNAM